MVKYLRCFILGIAVLAGCQSAKLDFSPSLPPVSRQTLTTPSSLTAISGIAPTIDAAFLAQLEQKIHERVNQYRLSRNLPPLRLDAHISYEARRHSQAMARGTAAFSHDGFENRVKAIGATIPYRKAGENLAVIQGYSDLVGTAVQGWINSPGHRKNMEGDFNLAGVGAAKNPKGEYYFTQIFVKER